MMLHSFIYIGLCYLCYLCILLYLFCLCYLYYLWCRWPDKKYVIICPPPVPRKTPSEAKEAKRANKFAESTVTIPDKDQESVNYVKGVMYYEYDLMFHYLLASLRRADGANSVTSTGVKTFNIFAGLGEHR